MFLFPYTQLFNFKKQSYDALGARYGKVKIPTGADNTGHDRSMEV